MSLFYLCMITILLLSVSPWASSESITHENQQITINYAVKLTPVERQQTYRWLQQVSSALLTVYGSWPKDAFNIKLLHSPSTQSPIPWGQVDRGDTDTVVLTINPVFKFKDFSQDWTAYHELSHLFIPYQGHGDLWFSEGLASYYQNIIQARSGLMSEIELWENLANGFARGYRQNTHSYLPLIEISDHMGKYRNFMRVHWSGVHYWLTADIKIRQRSQNTMSLDSLLKRLKDCCEHQSLPAREIAVKLDQLAGRSIFKPSFDEYRASHVMPDYRETLHDLGVKYLEYTVLLNRHALNADIRKSIYQGDV